MMLLQFDPVAPFREYAPWLVALAVVVLAGAALVGYLRWRWERDWKSEREANRRRRRAEARQVREKAKIDREIERIDRGRRP